MELSEIICLPVNLLTFYFRPLGACVRGMSFGLLPHVHDFSDLPPRGLALLNYRKSAL